VNRSNAGHPGNGLKKKGGGAGKNREKRRKWGDGCSIGGGPPEGIPAKERKKREREETRRTRLKRRGKKRFANADPGRELVRRLRLLPANRRRSDNKEKEFAPEMATGEEIRNGKTEKNADSKGQGGTMGA